VVILMLATLNAAKRYMGIAEDNHSMDLDIVGALQAATAVIERETKRSFEKKVYRQVIDGSGTQHIQLRNYPIHEVTKLLVCDKSIDSNSYTIESEYGMLFKRSGWPCGARLIEVEYLAGYVLPSDEQGAEPSTLPKNIELACALFAQILLRNPGVKSERVGDISVTYEDGELPAAVKSLIRL